jgi:hypothetical protein
MWNENIVIITVMKKIKWNKKKRIFALQWNLTTNIKIKL